MSADQTRTARAPLELAAADAQSAAVPVVVNQRKEGQGLSRRAEGVLSRSDSAPSAPTGATEADAGRPGREATAASPAPVGDSENLWRAIAEAGPHCSNWRSLNWHPDEFQRRHRFIEQFSFAVPTREAIARIAEFVGSRRLLEIGAGTGLWARLLDEAGVHVTAVDNHNRPHITIGIYYGVEKRDGLEAIERYSNHQALFLCWPEYSEPTAAKSLAAFRGDRLVYIGEGEGGCTADERFHEMLEAEWHCETVAIPQWLGIHDAVYLCRRKSGGAARNRPA